MDIHIRQGDAYAMQLTFTEGKQPIDISDKEFAFRGMYEPKGDLCMIKKCLFLSLFFFLPLSTFCQTVEVPLTTLYELQSNNDTALSEITRLESKSEVLTSALAKSREDLARSEDTLAAQEKHLKEIEKSLKVLSDKAKAKDRQNRLLKYTLVGVVAYALTK